MFATLAKLQLGWLRRSALRAFLLSLAAGPLLGQPAFINEIHYDNIGKDTGEAIEIAGPAGTDLSGWALVLYNGRNGASYRTKSLSGIIPDQTNGFGTIAFGFAKSIQNGAPDGIALVANGQVVQFLSYEGTFTAVGGPADGMTSIDIQVAESGSTPVEFSLQLKGTGTAPGDFFWSIPTQASFGAPNAEQVFGTDAASPPELRICEIQGASHTSPHKDEQVSTRGIVTAVARNGFYFQDPTGDGDERTSDGIFVYTKSAPKVAIGDEVQVTGTVIEYIPGSAATNNLSITEFSQPDRIQTLSTGNPTPAPVVLGAAGRQPPTRVIDNDRFAVFDPAEDGIDFYESLEGMLVEVPDAVAISPTNRFGEIVVLADAGAGQPLNSRGGLNLTPHTLHPQRIQLDDSLLPGPMPAAQVGDALGTVRGPVSYRFGNFEVLVLAEPVVESAGLVPETTALVGTAQHLTVGSFNVYNLDPNDDDNSADIADGQFAAIADQIVHRLRAPDVLALQEVQDNSGSANDGTTSADQTAQTLIAAIAAVGGPKYEYADVPPPNGTDGGQPGGNIRVAYLYQPARVALIGSVEPIEDDAFRRSRKPLMAAFDFKGTKLTVINCHFSSKFGSPPLFGRIQPPTNGGLAQRLAQAAFVHDLVADLLAADPNANIVVLGDLNESSFSLAPVQPPLGDVLQTLAGTPPILFNLGDAVDGDSAYSYNFQGISQQLDHLLVSAALLALQPEFDYVHVNTEFPNQASDHDPILARLLLY
ncbi:MAG: endonuclease/exonuclease/phosphatase family protein, partial [Gemmatimonadetes bacterium]|nr:endonuclease/exonuclease/phosphatase family protein [Gemmatimonadota bacterium]